MGREIYILTAGEYSDYRICAATLDKETVEKLQAILGRDYRVETQSFLMKAALEKWLVEEAAYVHRTSVYAGSLGSESPPPPLGELYKMVEKGRKRWRVCISKNAAHSNAEQLPVWPVRPVCQFHPWPGGFICEVWSNTKEGALKTASERRAKMLVEEEELSDVVE